MPADQGLGPHGKRSYKPEQQSHAGGLLRACSLRHSRHRHRSGNRGRSLSMRISPERDVYAALVVRSQRMVPIRCVNRTTSLLIWWADSPDAWESSVRIRPLGATRGRTPLAIGLFINVSGNEDDVAPHIPRSRRGAWAQNRQHSRKSRTRSGPCRPRRTPRRSESQTSGSSDPDSNTRAADRRRASRRFRQSGSIDRPMD